MVIVMVPVGGSALQWRGRHQLQAAPSNHVAGI